MRGYDPAYYEAFEARVAEEIAQDEASIGEIDTSLELSPCDGCPLMDFPISEAVTRSEGISSTAGKQSLEVICQFEATDGRRSREIILGRHQSNSIGSKRKAKMYADAAQRTIECEGPKKVMRFLGPWAVKRCPALESRRSSMQ
jgi:hypothetical protein